MSTTAEAIQALDRGGRTSDTRLTRGLAPKFAVGDLLDAFSRTILEMFSSYEDPPHLFCRPLVRSDKLQQSLGFLRLGSR